MFPKWDKGTVPNLKEYQGATDSGILAFIDRWRGLKDPNYRKRIRMDIAQVDQRTARDIQVAIGVDVSDFTGHSLSGNALEHIDKRHGAKGEADHSMADLNDIARMGYVLEHYDRVEALLTGDGRQVLSGDQYNADGSRAPLVRFLKRVDGTYYVVEAVPDSSAKEFRVVSAYMNKVSGDTDRLLNVPQGDPQLTSKTPDGAYVSATNPSIPQPTSAVKPGEASAQRSGPMSREALAEQIMSRALPLPQGSGDGQMERVIREGIQKGLTKLATTPEGKLALFNLALWKGDGFGKAFDEAITDWVVWSAPDSPTQGSDQLADALYTTLVDYFQNKLGSDEAAPSLDKAKTKLTRPNDEDKDVSLDRSALQKAPWSDIIGVITSDGHTVAKLKDHLFDRVTTRIVSEAEAIDALVHPLHQTDIKFDGHGQPPVQYIGTTATVVYNPDTNTVVTIWRAGKRYRKKYGGEKQ